MPQFLSDSFTDTAGTDVTAHTGETGATWTEHSSYTTGSWVISDANRARPAASGVVSLYYASGAPLSGNHFVEAVYRAITVPGSGWAGVAARVSTAAATYYWAIYNFAAGRWELWRAVAGPGTLMGSYTQTLSAGVDYTLRLRCFNTDISLWVDGVSRVAVSNGNVAGTGRASLIANGNWDNATGFHATSITAEDISQLTVVGDSIADGQNASVTANEFSSLLAADLGIGLAGAPVGGTQIVDMTTDDRAAGRNQVYFTSGKSAADIWAWMTGYNDMRYHGTNATALAQFERSLRAAIAWMSRIPANIKQASDAAWTFSPSWTAVTIANIGTKYRAASGATASISVSGTSVTVAYVNRWGLADGGTFTVTIDGTLVGTIDTNVGSSSGYGGASPTRYNIQAERYAGLSSGSHTVEIETTSAGTVQLAFVCGTGDTDKPDVRIGAPIKMASDGYTSNSPYNNGSDAAVEAYSTVIRKLVYEARLDGRNVKFADLNTYFAIANMDTDKVHPVDAGHSQLRDGFVAANYIRLADPQRAMPQAVSRSAVI